MCRSEHANGYNMSWPQRVTCASLPRGTAHSCSTWCCVVPFALVAWQGAARSCHVSSVVQLAPVVVNAWNKAPARCVTRRSAGTRYEKYITMVCARHALVPCNATQHVRGFCAAQPCTWVITRLRCIPSWWSPPTSCSRERSQPATNDAQLTHRMPLHWIHGGFIRRFSTQGKVRQPIRPSLESALPRVTPTSPCSWSIWAGGRTGDVQQPGVSL